MPDILRAIILMVFGMAFFTIGDIFLKFATQHMPIGMVTIFLGLGMTIMFALMMWHKADPIFDRKYLHPAIAMRCVGETVAIIGVITALAYSSLSIVTALIQFLPLLLTFMGAVFLKEKIGVRRISALLVGLIGVLIIIRPGMEGFDYYASFTLIGVFGMAIRDFSARIMPADISTVSMSFYGTLVIFFTGIGMMLVSQDWVIPSQIGMIYCLALVIVAAIGTLFVSSSMRLGDIGIISPFRFSRVVFGVGAGIFILGETIDTPTAIGSIIVVGAGLYSWLRERKLAKAT